MEENNVLKKFTTAQFLNFALGFLDYNLLGR